MKTATEKFTAKLAALIAEGYLVDIKAAFANKNHDTNFVYLYKPQTPNEKFVLRIMDESGKDVLAFCKECADMSWEILEFDEEAAFADED